MYYQNLLDIIVSKKRLINLSKPISLQITISPYIFLISTRPLIINKLFYDFFYLLNLSAYLIKCFIKKIFVVTYPLTELNSNLINLFTIRLYNPGLYLKIHIFKKRYVSYAAKYG